MNSRIFTKEQKEFLIRNVEELKRIESLIKKTNSLSEHSDRYVPIKGVKDYLHDNYTRAVENIQPFVKRDKIYQKRKNAILQEHGLSKDDELDEGTRTDILHLQQKMLEEVKDLTPDLRSKQISDKEKEAIFNPDGDRIVEFIFEPDPKYKKKVINYHDDEDLSR